MRLGVPHLIIVGVKKTFRIAGRFFATTLMPHPYFGT
jgi:hypothetical protein